MVTRIPDSLVEPKLRYARIEMKDCGQFPDRRFKLDYSLNGYPYGQFKELIRTANKHLAAVFENPISSRKILVGVDFQTGDLKILRSYH